MSKKYTAIIDVGTLLVHAALAAQQSYVVVRSKDGTYTEEFKTITEFWGHHTKKAGGVLSEVNRTRVEMGASQLLPEDFDVEVVTELVTEDEHSKKVDPVAIACGRFKNKIEAITSQPWCEDFVICHGVGENFRYAEAHQVAYKSKRPDKPLLMDEVKQYMLKKYKSKLFISENEEDDDGVTQYLWADWIKSGRNHDNLSVVGVYIDKDLNQTPCLHFNFVKPELGLIKVTSMDAAYSFASQLLTGDSVDTIPGLPFLHEDLHKKYAIRKASGIGAKTVKGLFLGLYTPKELFQRVVEAYKACYGDGQLMVTHRGVSMNWDWLDYLNEQYQLLRMRTVPQKPVGHVSLFLEKLGVDI